MHHEEDSYEWLTGSQIAARLQGSAHVEFATWIEEAGHGQTGALRPSAGDKDRTGYFDRARFTGAMQTFLKTKSYRLIRCGPNELMKLMAAEGTPFLEL